HDTPAWSSVPNHRQQAARARALRRVRADVHTAMRTAAAAAPTWPAPGWQTPRGPWTGTPFDEGFWSRVRHVLRPHRGRKHAITVPAPAPAVADQRSPRRRLTPQS